MGPPQKVPGATAQVCLGNADAPGRGHQTICSKSYSKGDPLPGGAVKGGFRAKNAHVRMFAV